MRQPPLGDGYLGVGIKELEFHGKKSAALRRTEKVVRRSAAGQQSEWF